MENMELLSELKHKMEAYRRWKLRPATWKEHKYLVCTYRNEIRKAKVQLELKGNREGFCKYIDSRR